jgi:hypothetical protein
MNIHPSLERCQTFINCQLQPKEGAYSSTQSKRAVTISRQAGCGAHAIGEQLAGLLQAAGPKDAPPWTVMDRDVVEKALENHHLPARLAKFMPEDRISEFSDMLDELFGLHPPSWLLVRNTAETILQLAELGNVILIGRGANVITRRMPHVFHVRIIGSVARRSELLQEFDHLSAKEALARIERQDLARKRFVKKYFGADIDNPLLYHLVINTDLIPIEKVAGIISHGMLNDAPARHRFTQKTGQATPALASAH